MRRFFFDFFSLRLRRLRRFFLCFFLMPFRLMPLTLPLRAVVAGCRYAPR